MKTNLANLMSIVVDEEKKFASLGYSLKEYAYNTSTQELNGTTNVIEDYKEDFAKECYGIMNMQCYIPKTIVQYNRKAFIAKENNIRITFDSNIIATEACTNIYEKNLNMYPVFNKGNTVLEVKYNGFLLGYIKDILNNVDKSEVSVSKYCLARTATLNYLYM